jgi:adenylyltransferase/sulfurtransferase
MPHDVIRIIDDQGADDRFGRFGLISWWDQSKLANARVLVAGAGALGNEIIKNLALLGVGNVLIADKDQIENSNLSRSVLFRAEDAGQPKAEVAARAAKAIYRKMNVGHFVGDIIHDLGVGVFRWADLVIAGMDNREARLAINRNCWRVNRPWIDGAIEQIQGVARVFIPSSDGPCYECTMSAADWKLLSARRSCNSLTRREMEGGKTPTTPTISSIIAGVQCQEAVKILHGMETIGGRGWVFQGLSTDAYLTEYQRKPDCYSHETLEEIIPLDEGYDSITIAQLLEKAAADLGAPVPLELCRDVLEKLICRRCGAEESVYESLGKVSASRAACPKCANLQRDVVTFDKIMPGSPIAARTPAQIGLPPFDLMIARAPGGGRSIAYEFSGDAPTVLGALADAGLELA